MVPLTSHFALKIMKNQIPSKNKYFDDKLIIYFDSASQIISISNEKIYLQRTTWDWKIGFANIKNLRVSK